MIKFTELRVNRGKLFISVKVRDFDFCNNIFIDKIKIDTQATFKDTGPSESAIIVYSSTNEENKKEWSGYFTSEQLGNVDMNNTMFFVYAIAKGCPSPDTPCGMDCINSVGVTFSLCPIYNETMQYVKEVENSCELPKNFINFILQFKAIQYSINSGHFNQAITYYNKFYKNLKTGTGKPCGCNG